MSNLFTELKRRNVFRVAIVYVLVGWLLAQVGELAADSFEAPAWVMKMFLVFLLMGFPVALIFAWAFEITPEGIKKEKDVDRSQSITHETSRKLDFAIIGVLVIALGYFVYQYFFGVDRVQTTAPDVATVSRIDDKSIAVLPFINMSEDASNAFFAGGVHEDILTYLSKVRDLRVISRSSVMKYADQTNVDLRQVGEDLGVAHILERSVRRAGNRVRVTAQLINTGSDEHVWAENYDAELDDVFEIQTSIAKEIVAALQANLSPQEQAAIEVRPTENIEAYDLYLIARNEIRKPGYYAEKYIDAKMPLEKALIADPDFAEAWLLLADVHLNLYWQSDATEDHVAIARDAIDHAQRLRPDSAEVHAALGEIAYRAHRDYETSLAELDKAHALVPNSAEILEKMGTTQRRLGLWRESIDSYVRAWALDPGDLSKAVNLIQTAHFAHEYERALSALDQVLADNPDDTDFQMMRGTALASYRGDLDALRIAFAGWDLEPGIQGINRGVTLPLAERDADGLLAILDRLDVVNGALGTTSPQALIDHYRGRAHEMKGDEAAAKSWWEKARLAREHDLKTPSPYDHLALADLGVINARLGHFDLAVEQTAQAIEDTGNDHLDLGFIKELHMRATLLAGREGEALDLLEGILGRPSGPSVWDIRLDPDFDRLAGNPRFEAMMEAAEEAL